MTFESHKILVLDRGEELAEQIRAALSDVDAQLEVVSCTRIGSAGHVQEHEGPFSVLVAGPSLGTKTGLKRLAMLRREAPETPIVMAISQRPDASLRDIVQVGAVDLLELPADDAALRASVRRALDIAARRGATSPAPATAAPAAPAQRFGRVFTVCSATGGCGKTFYATNAAMFLSQATKQRVVLVDLDLQFGEVTTALRLQPSYTISDLLKLQDGDLDAHLDEHLVRYGEHFSVLPAPKDPAQADYITPVEVTRLLELLRTRFDYVVVDTPTALAETVLAAFDLSEHLFVLATMDLPSVRNLGLFLQALHKLQIPQDNMSLILNKIESDVGIEVDEIVKHFPQGFRSRLPYAREVSRSINLGKPVLTSYPDGEVARGIVDGLREFLPEEERAATQRPHEPARRFRIGRLLGRRHAASGATS